MANEISWDIETGSALYACRFQLDGDVFLANGASDDTWGTGGRDADNYDVTMTEDGVGGHYVGSFDASSNIAAGVYRVVVYRRAGGSPVDSDIAIARGDMHWDGSAEIDVSTLSDQVDTLADEQGKVESVYEVGE